ncbi:anthranilate phosphoribosyltransferase 1 [Longispora fulva]|uniref:Anthranilate phosphoribosyltransferase n=1 Tax=Longispora fulva TaxID=619741 RepID=A0A8J7GGW9_9ACTN|nr:anthranilate phosphoribosyltransferase [Longispora fulva]MBG6135953.1 anthranilate phosphoribosyltransferase [Longispora fulva]GIG55803.1 anthranilate phosphoribosyltransferase 1 [Longispora fulva]
MTQPPVPWPSLVATLLDGDDLTVEQAASAMDEICSGRASPVSLAAFLTALRAKGAAQAEVTGFLRAITAHAVAVRVAGPVVDITGTGGDGARTVNVSTMAALVVAGTGTTVVKHGGRAASSASGAADVLEELGIPMDLGPDEIPEVVRRAGIAFCFAPRFHPGLRHAAPVRRELGFPTVFNTLGPLAHPARPTHQLLGVADVRTAPVLAAVLAARGTTALVVRGDDGLDELTVTTTSQVWSVEDGAVRHLRIDPRDLGIRRAAPGALRGGDARHNADVIRRVLAGETGPVRDAVLLNAAAALATVEPGRDPFTTRLAAALPRCAGAVDSGAASDVLRRWREASSAHAPASTRKGISDV